MASRGMEIILAIEVPIWPTADSLRASEAHPSDGE
jgi:hypothetical protein